MQRRAHPSTTNRPPRIAVFGGDARQKKRFGHLDNVVFYPASRCGGPHHAQRLIESLRSGGIARLIILTRWNGHSATRRIRDIARRYGVPVTTVA